jgi:hypothetical protein
MDSNSLMTPPEPGFFESLEAVQQHVQTHGTTQGYAVVTGQGTDKKNGKLNLICDRNGQYENHGGVPEDQKLRKRSSRKCGCEFKVVARRRPEGKWELQIKHGTHIKVNILYSPHHKS